MATPRAAAVAPVVATTEPHREPARVMKIRIGAWEDENGSLHGRSDVFTEIEPRRWTVGMRAVQPSPGFALLEGFGQGAAQDAQPAARAGAAGSRPGE
jgi:conjugal transfer pilus assembly protein TraV